MFETLHKHLEDHNSHPVLRQHIDGSIALNQRSRELSTISYTT